MEPRDLLAFGSGLGIQIGARNLEVVLVRVRPSGARVVAAQTIERYRERPAAEWGGEYADFLTRHGGGHLAATVLLPRSEVIVRQLGLPGVAAQDIESAIQFQLESLHPYGEAEIAHAWMRLDSAGAVLVGIVRREKLDRYLDLFAEAGVKSAAFTFSAAALFGASRVLHHPPDAGCLAISSGEEGTLEVYGESPAKPLFSAEFDVAPERAAALAGAELRLPVGMEPQSLDRLCVPPLALPADFDLSRNALPYAAALAGACPRLAPVANLLPAERRMSSSRAAFIPTAILAALLIAAAVVVTVYSRWRDGIYLGKLEAEIARIEPQARRTATLDSEIEKARARTRLLDDFRQRSKADLDALNELTRILAPPIWANSMELTRDTVSLAGEAEQAALLLKLIDSSPDFQNSSFTTPIARGGSIEVFRIRADREGKR